MLKQFKVNERNKLTVRVFINGSFSVAFGFQIIPIELFETQSADGRFVPICPSDHNINLTFSNRQEYVERALQYRLHEMDRQVATIREGMGWIIPVPLLSLLTVEKLEQMVCGSKEVSIEVLKKVAR